jgi:hypothetical protein
VSVTVVQPFRPFTVSPVMLVRWCEGLSPREVVLKLYDRRCMTNERRMRGQGCPYDPQRDRDYDEYLDQVLAGSIDRLHVNFDVPWCLDGLSPGAFEASLDLACHRLFEAERQTFLHLSDLQGTKIPQLLGVVSYTVARNGGPHPFVIPGLLMEYIPSASLRELFDTWARDDPPLPISSVPSICNEAISLVNLFSDRSVLNMDVRLDNFIVRKQEHSDGHRVVMIDFARCRLRCADETDWKWAEAKQSQDEESAIGYILGRLINTRLGDGVWRYSPSLRFAKLDDSDSE